MSNWERSITDSESISDLITFPILGIFVFAFGTLLSAIGYFSARSSYHKSKVQMLLLVNIVSVISSTATHFGPQQPVNIMKYAQWALSFPSLISLLGVITNKQRQASILSYYFCGYLTCQFISNTSRDPASTYALSVGVYCYYKVLDGIDKLFQRVAVSPLNKTLRKGLRTVVLASWLLLPVTFAGINYGLISSRMGEIYYLFSELPVVLLLTLVLTSLPENNFIDLSQISVEKLSKQAIQDMAKDYDSATFVFGEIMNYKELSLDTAESLINKFGKLADKSGITIVENQGGRFLGFMGNTDRPDHNLGSLNFAMAMVNVTKSFKTAKGDEVIVQVGVDSGIVTGSGDNLKRILTNTQSLKSTSKLNHIHLTENVYEETKSTKFQYSGPHVSNHNGTTTATYSISC